jgi:hypothetical protein
LEVFSFQLFAFTAFKPNVYGIFRENRSQTPRRDRLLRPNVGDAFILALAEPRFKRFSRFSSKKFATSRRTATPCERKPYVVFLPSRYFYFLRVFLILQRLRRRRSAPHFPRQFVQTLKSGRLIFSRSFSFFSCRRRFP